MGEGGGGFSLHCGGGRLLVFVICYVVAVSPGDGFTSTLIAFVLLSCVGGVYVCGAQAWLTCAGGFSHFVG